MPFVVYYINEAPNQLAQIANFQLCYWPKMRCTGYESFFTVLHCHTKKLSNIKVKKIFYFDRFECGSWNSNIQWFLTLVFHNQFGQLDWIKSWNSAHQSCQSLIIRKPWNNVENFIKEEWKKNRQNNWILHLVHYISTTNPKFWIYQFFTISSSLLFLNGCNLGLWGRINSRLFFLCSSQSKLSTK